jgi:hypothetical protein
VLRGRGDKLRVLGVLRIRSGIIDDRADESRRLLLVEKSDRALGEGEGAEGGFSLEEADDGWEFRIIDRRRGFRDRGPDESGWRSSTAGEFCGDRMRG